MNYADQPNDVDAERTVLGAVLVDNQCFSSAIESMSMDDLYREGHRRIWVAMASLFEKSSPIDLVTLKNELLLTSSLDSVGGVSYLAGLVDGVPRLENVTAWAKIVREKATRRRLIAASAIMASEAIESPDAADAVLDRAEQAIFDIADQRASKGLQHVGVFMKETFSEIEASASANGKPTGITSGFVDLDRYTAGFQRSDLVIVAARPAMGKTSLAINIMAHAATKKPVAFFSMEMSRHQILKRLIYSEARIDSSIVSRGQLRDNDWAKLTAAWSAIQKLPIFIDDASIFTPLDIRAKCRRLVSQVGEIGVIIVDYLQLMASGQRVENRQNEVAAISRSLKAIAKEMNVPVIALAQLSRDLEKRVDKRPQLSDLRESGSLEQEADIVAFLYRECVYNPQPDNHNIAELILSKHRSGPTGVVNLAFLREYTRFESAALPGFNEGY